MKIPVQLFIILLLLNNPLMAFNNNNDEVEHYFETEVNDFPSSIGTQMVIDDLAILNGESNQDQDVWLLDDAVFTTEIYVKKINGNAAVKIYESDSSNYAQANVHMTLSSSFAVVPLDENKFYYIQISEGNVNGHQVQIGNREFTPLPVELIDFSSSINHQNSIQLEWSTASEVNNDFFEVQYSTNGWEFQIIGIVEGNGNSIEINNYKFTHHRTISSLNYYRLKQVDFNGEYEYSPIIIQKLENIQNDLVISPNPSFDNTVLLNSKSIGFVQVYSMNGKLINSYLKNDIDFELDISNLEKGVYTVLILEENNNIITQKLVRL